MSRPIIVLRRKERKDSSKAIVVGVVVISSLIVFLALSGGAAALCAAVFLANKEKTSTTYVDPAQAPFLSPASDKSELGERYQLPGEAEHLPPPPSRPEEFGPQPTPKEDLGEFLFGDPKKKKFKF